MLALRTAKGLNILDFNKATGLDFYKEYASPIKKYNHCFEEKDGYIFIKDKEKSLSQFDCERDRLNIGVF
jgi:hypothetical protein